MAGRIETRERAGARRRKRRTDPARSSKVAGSPRALLRFEDSQSRRTRLSELVALLLAVSLVAVSCGGATEIDDLADRSSSTSLPADPDDAEPEADPATTPAETPSPPPTPQTGETPSPSPTPTAAPEPTPGPPPPPDLTKSPSVFFAPVPSQPVGANLPLPDGASDFMELFEPGARWSEAAERIDGFKLHSWMIRHYLSDSDLVAIYAGLRDRGIPLIIEAEPLDPPDPAECNHSESFEGPYEIENLERLEALDIEVAMLAIEQPYSFGHRLDGPGSCRYDVGRVVDEVVAWIADARAVYPDIPVGSIEAIWSDPVTTADDFAEWLDAYEAASGESFAFINVDPNFNWAEWGEVALGIEAVADARGIPFGILYNGNISTTHDAYLLEIAELFAYYERDLGGTPDQVVIQSWHDLPDRLLPDDDPTAMTSLVNRYFGARAAFDATELTAGGGNGALPKLTGRLTSADGEPLPGRTVQVRALPTDGPLQSATITGTVPRGAAEALVAVRVNAEDADPGDTDTILYGVEYREGADGPNLVPNGAFDGGLSSWGVYGEPLGSATPMGTDAGAALQLTASAEQQIWIDGGRFAVTPDADFEFIVDFGSPVGTERTVTVAIIFLDVSESSRSTVVLAPRPIDAAGWTAETDEAGMYTVELDGLVPGAYRLSIRTDGDARTWVASTTADIEIP